MIDQKIKTQTMEILDAEEKRKRHRVYMPVMRDSVYLMSSQGWNLDPQFQPFEDYEFKNGSDNRKYMFFWMWIEQALLDLQHERDHAQQQLSSLRSLTVDYVMRRWDEMAAAARLGGKTTVVPILQELIDERLGNKW